MLRRPAPVNAHRTFGWGIRQAHPNNASPTILERRLDVAVEARRRGQLFAAASTPARRYTAFGVATDGDGEPARDEPASGFHSDSSTELPSADVL